MFLTAMSNMVSQLLITANFLGVEIEEIKDLLTRYAAPKLPTITLDSVTTLST